MKIYCSTWIDVDCEHGCKNIKSALHKMGIKHGKILTNPMVDCYVITNVSNIPVFKKRPIWFNKWCTINENL